MSWLSVRKTYGWKICPQSCSLACGITGNLLRLTHNPCARLRGLNLIAKWAQTCILKAHKHMHTTARREGTLNLSWNHKYINRYGARAFCFSHRSAGLTNSGAAQKSRVDTLGLAAHRRLSLIAFAIKSNWWERAASNLTSRRCDWHQHVFVKTNRRTLNDFTLILIGAKTLFTSSFFRFARYNDADVHVHIILPH